MQIRNKKEGSVRDYLIVAILLIVAIYLAISRNQDGISKLRQFSVATVSVLQTPLSQVRIYRQALNTNVYLKRQNILLQDELSKLRSLKQENEELRDLLDFHEQSQLDLIPVKVVGKELNSINNSLTITPGAKAGIKKDMPLVNSDGLLGKVVLVTDNYAQVMPYLNTLYKVSAKVQNNNAPGIVSWEGNRKNELVMNFVPLTVDVDEGAVIETSGFSNQYPPNIPIGVVTKIEQERGKETQRIYLEPTASIYDVAEGFVVKFTPDQGIDSLKTKYDEIIK